MNNNIATIEERMIELHVDLLLDSINLRISNNDLIEDASPLDEAEQKTQTLLEELEAMQNPEAAENIKTAFLKELVSWITMLAAAILAALFINFCVIVNAEVPTGSMENTIMTGDRMFGFRLSYLFSEPERGDVIIFKFPDDESQQFVKRIIGLPGETVEIRDSKVYINGSDTPLDESYLKEAWVTFADGYVFEVPENAYFVMGDNRNDSHDSRFWSHPHVDADAIIGKALFTYWPFGNIKKIQ